MMSSPAMVALCVLTCVLGAVILFLSVFIISCNRRLAIAEGGKDGLSSGADDEGSLVKARKSSSKRLSILPDSIPAVPSGSRTSLQQEDLPPAEGEPLTVVRCEPKPVVVPPARMVYGHDTAVLKAAARSSRPVTEPSTRPAIEPKAAVGAAFESVRKSQIMEQLSIREQMSRMLDQGEDPGQIAASLGVSVGTVRLAVAVREAKANASLADETKYENLGDEQKNPRNRTGVSDMNGAWCVGSTQ